MLHTTEVWEDQDSLTGGEIFCHGARPEVEPFLVFFILTVGEFLPQLNESIRSCWHLSALVTSGETLHVKLKGEKGREERKGAQTITLRTPQHKPTLYTAKISFGIS